MKKREVWIDYTKLIACILVALGHFYLNMVAYGVYKEGSMGKWFSTTIYYFHVPLFLICSGYLYQEHSKVSDMKSYFKNVKKKLIALGIPYIIFCSITWILKNGFSGVVNNDTKYSLLSTLFLHPISSYWFLYALIAIMLITPTINNKRIGVLIVSLAIIFKVISMSEIYKSTYILGALVVYVTRSYIWFVGGMILAIIVVI